jgi:hypothetical protein
LLRARDSISATSCGGAAEGLRVASEIERLLLGAEVFIYQPEERGDQKPLPAFTTHSRTRAQTVQIHRGGWSNCRWLRKNGVGWPLPSISLATIVV